MRYGRAGWGRQGPFPAKERNDRGRRACGGCGRGPGGGGCEGQMGPLYHTAAVIPSPIITRISTWIPSYIRGEGGREFGCPSG